MDNALPKLNSVLKVLLDFLHFAKDFAQNQAKENGTVQKYTTKFFSQGRNYCYGRFGAEIRHLFTILCTEKAGKFKFGEPSA